MFGSCMDCLEQWFWIKVFSLSENSLVSSIACWEFAWQPPQHTTHKWMGRQKGSTKNWNSTSAFWSTRDRTSGMTSCLWLSSSTTTMFMLQHVSCPLCWTLDTTPGWALNLTNPLDTSNPSTSSRNEWKGSLSDAKVALEKAKHDMATYYNRR